MLNIRRAIAAVCAAVVVVALPTPASAALTPLTVVAVGDSYASGEGAMGGMPWLNAACHRSALAGPQQAAALVAAGSFTSLACSGSTIFGGGAFALLGAGGQLSLLPGGTIDALTMSIGGNDIGFGTIVTTCMIPLWECGTDPAVTGPLATSLAALPAALDTALVGVPTRVRHVFLTEYPDPTTGSFGGRCGDPWAPAFQGFDGISSAEAAFAAASVVAPLNMALSAAVTRANARSTTTRFHFVTGVVSRFATHGYCTGIGSPLPHDWLNPRYLNTPTDSIVNQGDHLGTMHPNDLGQAAIAAALADSMRNLSAALVVNASVVGSALLPSTVTVTASTTAGDPARGASVFLDGVFAGVTDVNGRLVVTWTFATAGTHTATVDVNPHPATSRAFTVQGASYRVTSSPSPIPMNQAITLALTASDSATNALVAGTFALRQNNATTSIPSGGSVSISVRANFVYEEGPSGKPVKVLTCPTLSFTPSSSVYTARSFSSMINCPL